MDKKEFIQRLIEKLDLQPLPVEGGMFAQSYKSKESLDRSALSPRYNSGRRLGTAIFYLLTDEPDSFSCMHHLLTDEIYHFYLGDPVEMLLLYPDGTSSRLIFGPDILGGQLLQFSVPRGVWQGSHLAAGGSYALIGTTMAPGYEDEDFTLGLRSDLCRHYPQEAELIRLLTRQA
jgi:uncharacterized protein